MQDNVEVSDIKQALSELEDAVHELQVCEGVRGQHVHDDVYVGVFMLISMSLGSTSLGKYARGARTNLNATFLLQWR